LKKRGEGGELREGCGGRRRAKRAAGTALSEAKGLFAICLFYQGAHECALNYHLSTFAEAKAKPGAARPEHTTATCHCEGVARSNLLLGSGNSL